MSVFLHTDDELSAMMDLEPKWGLATYIASRSQVRKSISQTLTFPAVKMLNELYHSYNNILGS